MWSIVSLGHDRIDGTEHVTAEATSRVDWPAVPPSKLPSWTDRTPRSTNLDSVARSVIPAGRLLTGHLPVSQPPLSGLQTIVPMPYRWNGREGRGADRAYLAALETALNAHKRRVVRERYTDTSAPYRQTDQWSKHDGL